MGLVALALLAAGPGISGAAGPFVLVTEWGEQGGAGVARVDPATDRIAGRVANAGSPRHMTLDPVRRVAYASLHYGDRVAAILPDTLELAELDIPGLGRAPIGVSLTPDGLRLLVATRGDDGLPNGDDRLDVVALDHSSWPPSCALIQSIPTGAHPVNAIVDRAGRYAVVTARNEPAILAVDLTTYQVVWQAPGLPANAEPEGGDAHPTEDLVYVTLHGANTIEVIDLNPPRILRHVPITSNTGRPVQPSAVAFTTDGARAYVSGQAVNRVLLFDAGDARDPVQDTVVEIPVGPQPHEIVWLEGDRGYVANTNNMQPLGSLSVLHDVSGAPTATGPILTDLAGPLSFAYFEALETPSLASLSCDSGVAGDTIVLRGGPFLPYQGTSGVTVNGLAAVILAWADTEITVELPPGVASGPVLVWVRGEPSNALELTAGSPLPSAVTRLLSVKASPEVALAWDEVTTTLCGTPLSAATYNIYRGVDARAIGTLAGTAPALSFTTAQADLTDPQSFFYQIRALDGAGREGP